MCALGFSVRFGLKHTLRCVIWVKSWKLEALIWAGSGVNQKTYFQKKDINTADFLYDNDNENMAIFYLVASAQQAWHYNQSGSHVWEQQHQLVKADPDHAIFSEAFKTSMDFKSWWYHWI